jgi:hypothetical protein
VLLENKVWGIDEVVLQPKLEMVILWKYRMFRKKSQCSLVGDRILQEIREKERILGKLSIGVGKTK